MNDLYRKLGSEKLENFKKDFDLIIDKYRMLATASGLKGELVFKKEHGKMIIFIKK